MFKRMFVLFLVMILALAVGCNQSSNQPANQSTTDLSSAQPGEANNGSDDEPLEIAVIIKATDSGFWQTVLQGAIKAGEDLGDKVNITTDGPPSEADIDQQVTILENVISRNPDGIVIASTSSDATVPAIENAMGKNIPVVLVDNLVHTDQYISFLATDNIVGGALAADMLVEGIKASGKELNGEVGMISSMAGVQVNIDRNEGFINRLQEIAPDIRPLDIRYTDNDITRALGAAEDLLTSNPDILGFFADNNHTGIGVARAITERNLQGKVPVVAYDSDDEQINALTSGAIYSLIVQDPFGMGYKGVISVIDHLEGRSVEKKVDTGATAVTQANFDDDEIQKLLYPEKR